LRDGIRMPAHSREEGRRHIHRIDPNLPGVGPVIDDTFRVPVFFLEKPIEHLPRGIGVTGFAGQAECREDSLAVGSGIDDRGVSADDAQAAVFMLPDESVMRAQDDHPVVFQLEEGLRADPLFPGIALHAQKRLAYGFDGFIMLHGCSPYLSRPAQCREHKHEGRVPVNRYLVGGVASRVVQETKCRRLACDSFSISIQ